MKHLTALSRPFPTEYISRSPQGADYVGHATVNQALLATLGPFSFAVDQIVRDSATQKICAVLATLTVTIDGKEVSVTEAGDVDDKQASMTSKKDGTKIKNDGALLKDCMSDALKRCAMRLGLGLHLWCKDQYFLHSSLAKKASDEG